jgi:3-oxoacyl-[acyl-carrier protein] reductase
MRLDEVRAIVTGAAGGLGRHFVLQLLAAGAQVAACDVNWRGLEALKAEPKDGNARLVTAALDVSQEPAVAAFVSETAAQFGGINTLVNNAGVLRDGLLIKDEAGWMKKLPMAQWKQVLDVNLTGSYLFAREVAADMLQRQARPGVIVNISSLSRSGNPGQSAYAASKAALDACTRTWALELAAHGIRVGGIAPGVIDTPMLKHISDDAMRRILAEVPLQRIGTPHEIWLALRFIIECDYFTGRVIEVDGGSDF